MWEISSDVVWNWSNKDTAYNLINRETSGILLWEQIDRANPMKVSIIDRANPMKVSIICCTPESKTKWRIAKKIQTNRIIHNVSKGRSGKTRRAITPENIDVVALPAAESPKKSLSTTRLGSELDEHSPYIENGLETF